MTGHAWFWEWGAGGLRAWHLWNEQTSRKVLEYGLAERPLEAARAFALASFAVHDAAVACWDAKYAYWAMRPFQVDPELKPLFSAPNHPSFQRPMPASRPLPDTPSQDFSRSRQSLYARSRNRQGMRACGQGFTIPPMWRPGG